MHPLPTDKCNQVLDALVARRSLDLGWSRRPNMPASKPDPRELPELICTSLGLGHESAWQHKQRE